MFAVRTNWEDGFEGEVNFGIRLTDLGELVIIAWGCELPSADACIDKEEFFVLFSTPPGDLEEIDRDDDKDEDVELFKARKRTHIHTHVTTTTTSSSSVSGVWFRKEWENTTKAIRSPHNSTKKKEGGRGEEGRDKSVSRNVLDFSNIKQKGTQRERETVCTNTLM